MAKRIRQVSSPTTSSFLGLWSFGRFLNIEPVAASVVAESDTIRAGVSFWSFLRRLLHLWFYPEGGDTYLLGLWMVSLGSIPGLEA